MDVLNEINAVRMNTLLHDFDLVQCVTGPTHGFGHTLDLVIVRSDCDIGEIVVDPPSLSDHGLIRFSLPFQQNRLIHDIIETRGWKKLDKDLFRAKLQSSPICGDLSALGGLHPDDLFGLYDETLHDLLNSMLPVRKVKTRIQPNAP